MIGDSREHVGEPGLRIDVVQFASDDQGIHHNSALAAAVGTGEEPGFSAERYAVCITEPFSVHSAFPGNADIATVLLSDPTERSIAHTSTRDTMRGGKPVSWTI
jgi:hypothetical protein